MFAPAFIGQQYSAAPGSAASATAGEREHRGDGDRERGDQQRLGECAEEADGRGAGRDDLPGDRDPGDDAKGTREERQTAGGSLLSCRINE